MSIIVKKNKYETWRSVYDSEKKKGNSDNAATALKKMLDAKADQDKQIVLGGLQKIHYRRYWNDPSPLFLSMSYVSTEYSCAVGLNLHYLLTKDALKIIDIVMKSNKFAINNGRPLTIEYNMFKNLRIPMVAYRMYKFQKIRPIEYIPIADWKDVVKKERSPWQGKFYGMSQAEKDKQKKIKRKRQRKKAKKRSRR